ncbi:hypothetical protein Bca4012_042281 [Brassica carinata]
MPGIVCLLFIRRWRRHSEPMEYMRNLRQFRVTFATNCSQLMNMIIHVPRMHNSKTNSLARIACSIRKQPSFVVHMDA